VRTITSSPFVLPLRRGIEANGDLMKVAVGIASAIAESFLVNKYEVDAAARVTLVANCAGVKSAFHAV
jgi:hypothetical protein